MTQTTTQNTTAPDMPITGREDPDSLRAWLLAEHAGTIDHDRLHTMSEQITSVVTGGVPGAIVEVGCYRGAMSLWIRALLDDLADHTREIHVYDSFEGLPPPGPQDSAHLARGELATTPGDVRATHTRWGKHPPVIHPGWFADTLPTRLPEPIAFAYLDGDFYDSVHTSLVHCVPRLAPGGRVLVDDYADTKRNPRAWDGLPGVKRACEDYFGRASPLDVLVGHGDLAYGLFERPA